MSKRSQIINQLLTAIEKDNVDRLFIALVIALAQQPAIDLNQIQQNGHTILTFAALHYNSSIIIKLVREPSVNVNQVNAFNQTPFQIANRQSIPEAALKYLFKIGQNLGHPCPLKVAQYDQKPATTTKRYTYACNQCPRTFNRPNRLRAHKFMHTGERPFKCQQCDRTFTSKRAVFRHGQIHTDRKYNVKVSPHLRQHSTNKISPQASVENPETTVQKERKCETCNKVFSSTTCLAIHKRTHTGERPFKCNECSYASSQRSNLKRHKQSAHNNTEPFHQYYSNPVTKHVSSVVTNNNSSSPQKSIRRYKCEICNKAFLTASHLSRHIRIHTNERPFECHLCQKTFSFQTSLERHHLVHGVVNPHYAKCKICDKICPNTSDLARHMRIHTGEQPYECNECGKKFRQLSNMYRHKRTHTGERPYKCDMCDYASSEGCNLQRHKRKMHDFVM